MLYLAGVFSSGSKLFDVITHHRKFLLDQFDGKQVIQSEHTHCSTDSSRWTKEESASSGLGSCPHGIA